MVLTELSSVKSAISEASNIEISDNFTNTKKDSTIKNSKPLFEVKDCIIKGGQGMFASKVISPGQIILREKPLIVMPDIVFSSEDPDYIEEWLDKKILKLCSEDRAKFYNLVDSRSFNDEKTSLGIFYTNDMNYIEDSAALFPVMARVNHACAPNADFITRANLGIYAYSFEYLVLTKLVDSR